MNKFKLTFLTLVLFLSAILFGVFAVVAHAQTVSLFRTGNIFAATNNTKQSPGWTDPLTNVDPGNVVQFSVMVENDGNTDATGTHVQVSVPGNSGTTLTPTATITATNANSVSDTVTITSDTGGAFSFDGLVPGDTWEWGPGCANGCKLPDTIITSGVDLGTVQPLSVSGNNIAVTFKLFTLPAAGPTPSPTVTPTPTPTPTPGPTATPTPTPTPAVTPTPTPGAVSQTCQAGQVQVGINQAGQIICQNISNSASATGGSATGGSVTITNASPAPAPAVAGVSTSVTTLPKTGLPELAWALVGFLPIGAKLRNSFKVKGEMEDHPQYLFEQRQFKKEA